MVFSRINWDALGVTTSVVCAIHCAVLPLAMASLPVLGVNIIHNAGFEFGMIALALAIGARALWHGFRRHHGRLMPLVIFLAGMIFLIAKQIWHDYELALLPFAVSGIIAAHVLNYRQIRRKRIALRTDIRFPELTCEQS